MNTRTWYLILGGGVVAAHIVLLASGLPLVVRTLAALVIVGIAPGALLASLLLPTRDESPQSFLERGVFIAALAFATLTLGMLLISYLPGGITRWQVLAFYDATMLILAAALWWTQRSRRSGGQHAETDSLFAAHPSPLISLLILLLLAGALRFTNLGYAEFHGDEARAVLRAAAVIQGHEDALLIHRKGPVEILVPAAVLALTGQIDETSARLPFALAGLAAIVAIWLLGWRLLDAHAGWIAALLLALSGYYVAFARFVQYQSVVILATAAALLVLATLLDNRAPPRRHLLLAAILFATALLAHYDALAAAPALAVLIAALFVQRRGERRSLLIGTVIAALAGGALLALYYVPFLRNPTFGATVDYLLGERIGASGERAPYNNLVDLFVRGALYNSAYQMLLLGGLLVAGLVLVFLRGYRRSLSIALALVALAVAGWLAASGGSLVVAGRDVTVVPVTALLLLACIAPRLGAGRRVVWVWFATAFVVAIFFTARPRTHVHVFFAPLALIAGDVLAAAWLAATRRVSTAGRAWLAAAATAVVAVVLGGYLYLLYVQNDPEVLQTWPEHAPAAYWSPPGVEDVDGRFGFPFANGWKVIGALYADGTLSGDYETNQRYMWVPDWYTRGRFRCGSTAEWFFAVNSLEPWMEGQAQIADLLAAQGYRPWGVVTVGGDERMTIYNNDPAVTTGEVRRLALEDYAPVFDALATANLPLAYPVVTESPTHALDINFGDEIQLVGYDLAPIEPLRPGGQFRLKLFWRAIGPATGSHKVSVQSYYGNGTMVAQKDALPVCDREPTTTWDLGETVVDIHDVTVNADAPPGTYPLFVGLYHSESGEPLPVLDAAGNPAGTQAQIGEIEIR